MHGADEAGGVAVAVGIVRTSGRGRVAWLVPDGGRGDGLLCSVVGKDSTVVDGLSWK